MSKKHKKDDHEEHIDETWLIPYADLLTLLLALFIVLYAMSSVDAQKFQALSNAFSIAFNTGSGVLDNPARMMTGEALDNKRSDQGSGELQSDQDPASPDTPSREELMQLEQEDLEELKQQLDQYIEENGLLTELETRLNHSQLMIVISDNALFASGSAALRPESEALALAIADMLSEYPDYKIIVAGHTDNQPINTVAFASNWELSAQRAIGFMNILLTNPNLDRGRFSATAYGEYQPVDTNSTEAGRAKNRRVEVQIMRNYVDASNVEALQAATP